MEQGINHTYDLRHSIMRVGARFLLTCAPIFLMACNPFEGDLIKNNDKFHYKVLGLIWGEPLPKSLVLLESQYLQSTLGGSGHVWYHIKVDADDFSKFIDRKQLSLFPTKDKKGEFVEVIVDANSTLSIRTEEFVSRFKVLKGNLNWYFVGPVAALNGAVDNTSTPTLHIYLGRNITSKID